VATTAANSVTATAWGHLEGSGPGTAGTSSTDKASQNRWLIGGEVDATFPSFQKLPTGVNPFDVSIGGTSNFTSPTLGAVSFTETVLSEGTVRAQFGYAPGHWLFYATGGTPTSVSSPAPRRPTVWC
jgi:hypothetical protein